MAVKVSKRMVEVEEYVTSDGTVFRNKAKAEAHERTLAESVYIVTYHFTGSYDARVSALNEEEAKIRAREFDYPYPEDITWELESMEAEEA